MKEKLISVLALFTSTGTLLCCVLPAAVATVAGGASVGSMLSLFPWLIPLSIHKEWIFVTAGILIALNGFMVFKPRKKQFLPFACFTMITLTLILAQTT